MALADVKVYFKQVETQWLEAKNDLKDLEQALKDGYITEERLTDIKADFDIIDTNYQRLAYIMHLFAIPNRHSHKQSKAEQDLAKKLTLVQADDDYVGLENQDALTNLRKHIDQLLIESTKEKQE